MIEARPAKKHSLNVPGEGTSLLQPPFGVRLATGDRIPASGSSPSSPERLYCDLQRDQHGQAQERNNAQNYEHRLGRRQIGSLVVLERLGKATLLIEVFIGRHAMTTARNAPRMAHMAFSVAPTRPVAEDRSNTSFGPVGKPLPDLVARQARE